MRISVFGLGYVGSVTAACLARAGHHVIGVDTAQAKVDAIARGEAPVSEPGLDALVATMVAEGRLSATSSGEEAIAGSELALICVGTPGRDSGQPDLWAVRRVAEQIGAALRSRIGTFTVVLRSTVLPGTTERILMPSLLSRCGASTNLQIAVNPEFMREGCALDDFSNPPMTLVGCSDRAVPAVRVLYEGIDAPFVHTAVRTAEMAKYASNSWHALKICFANELGQLCATLGADADEVMSVFKQDRKLNISAAYLRPGFAFGGSCLPKDVRALAYAARAAEVDTPLLASILPSNDAHLKRGLAQILSFNKRRIGLIGLAFKPGTDDVRESPLLLLVETLIGKGYDLRIFDANLEAGSLTGANRQRFDENIPHIASLCCTDPREVTDFAEVLVIGHRSEAGLRALAAARPEQQVVDLTLVSAPLTQAEPRLRTATP